MINLHRARNVAKDRIIVQFGDLLKNVGVILVDCSPGVGLALVEKDSTGFYNIQWLEPHQRVELAGRIDAQIDLGDGK